MHDILTVGDVQEMTYTVPADKTVPHLYPESEDYRIMPEVFATGFMVGLLEWSAIRALRPVLEEGEGSLGTMVNILHSAPTPPGARLTVTARCVRVDKNYVEWEVEARDDDGDVAAKGTHGRHVIDTGRFLKRVAAKAERLVPVRAS
ncbi:thioesterase family protein [Nocardia sp. NPDC024068]|uniref:thioesterase family protein n=1 Tax=Nocardia sp. NPDC024068 TaxID=3157197 RepID=UPI0033F4598A